LRLLFAQIVAGTDLADAFDAMIAGPAIILDAAVEYEAALALHADPAAAADLAYRAVFGAFAGFFGAASAAGRYGQCQQ
jgi:hypothetical protein